VFYQPALRITFYSLNSFRIPVIIIIRTEVSTVNPLKSALEKGFNYNCPGTAIFSFLNYRMNWSKANCYITDLTFPNPYNFGLIDIITPIIVSDSLFCLLTTYIRLSNSWTIFIIFYCQSWCFEI